MGASKDQSVDVCRHDRGYELLDHQNVRVRDRVVTKSAVYRGDELAKRQLADLKTLKSRLKGV